jgi:hypothetical protein
MGCGTKEHPGSYDTPGWKLQNIDTIGKKQERIQQNNFRKKK